MKLLLCTECGDIFNLSYEVRQCTCGKTSGKYIDNLNAEYYGGTPLGFDNRTLVEAIKQQPNDGLGRNFTAFVIPKQCKTFIRKE